MSLGSICCYFPPRTRYPYPYTYQGYEGSWYPYPPFLPYSNTTTTPTQSDVDASDPLVDPLMAPLVVEELLFLQASSRPTLVPHSSHTLVPL